MTSLTKHLKLNNFFLLETWRLAESLWRVWTAF